jgi:hypothetical protein
MFLVSLETTLVVNAACVSTRLLPNKNIWLNTLNPSDGQPSTVEAMNSWVKDLPKRSAEEQKGKGKGKGQDRSVKPRVHQDAMQCVIHAVQAVGENSLQNSRAIRTLTGLAMSTSLVPADPILVTASSVEPTPKDPHREHLLAWAHLVTGLSAHAKVPTQYKQVLATHAAGVDKPEDLADKVLFCRVQATFGDANQYKVQFSVTPDLH